VGVCRGNSAAADIGVEDQPTTVRFHPGAEQFPIALVSMPFVAAEVPSIQLGLLKAIAQRDGFPVTTYHLALDFAIQVGLAAYSDLANHRGRQVGDWLFSRAAFGRDAPDPDGRFLRDFSSELAAHLPHLGQQAIPFLQRIRAREVPSFIDRMMREIPWQRYRVVGFTSTFQQSVASFALAARIKQQFPHIITVFGGANFDGEMGPELVRTIDCIDYAVAGEADDTFPEFLKALLAGHDPANVTGVLARSTLGVQTTSRKIFRDLDRLPTPDFTDYYAQAERLGLFAVHGRDQVSLPFESARGCWWGEKHHCTFCGLNGVGMAFRGKSARRVLDELSELSRRHRTFRFTAVDNILSMQYLETFLPQLIADGTTYTLFYETKANLKREHLELFASAGVRCIQPGIESLNSRVLMLMRKGVTAIQNVNVLRWARYYGICVIWNVIWGFPGETAEDYSSQTNLVPNLIHLQPPESASRIWMERFSPIFSNRAEFPANYVRSESSYAYVYPHFVDKERVAYFFEYEFSEHLPDSTYRSLEHQLHTWQRAWQVSAKPRLTFRRSPEFLQVTDSRSADVTTYNMVGPLAALYAACSDRPRSAASLKESLKIEWSESKSHTTLCELAEQGLMMRENDLFLTLAIPCTHSGQDTWH
jgi:ribosomal peptide maturation radical SAM protein 1